MAFFVKKELHEAVRVLALPAGVAWRPGPGHFSDWPGWLDREVRASRVIGGRPGRLVVHTRGGTTFAREGNFLVLCSFGLSVYSAAAMRRDFAPVPADPAWPRPGTEWAPDEEAPRPAAGVVRNPSDPEGLALMGPPGG